MGRIMGIIRGRIRISRDRIMIRSRVGLEVGIRIRGRIRSRIRGRDLG